jgi:PAS domain S-box-containing protein
MRDKIDNGSVNQMNKKSGGRIDFTGAFVFLGVGLGVFYWVLQAFIDAYIFENGHLMKHIFSPHSYEIWIRSMVIFILVLSSAFVQSTISKLKRAESALRDNEAMLRATIESSASGVLVVDGRGKAVHSNTRFAEMWRIPDDLMQTKDDERLLEYVISQLADPQAFLKKVRELYNSPKVDHDKILFKDGRIFDRYSQPLKRDNNISGRVWSFYDITESERVSSRLKMTQFSVDNAPEPVFWMGSDARFIYVNKAACKVLGYTEKELLSMTVHDIDPDFPVEVWPEHWQDLKQKHSMTIKSHHKTKLGIVFPVEISLNFIKFDGCEYNCAIARKIYAERSSANVQRIPAANTDNNS